MIEGMQHYQDLVTVAAAGRPFTQQETYSDPDSSAKVVGRGFELQEQNLPFEGPSGETFVANALLRVVHMQPEATPVREDDGFESELHIRAEAQWTAGGHRHISVAHYQLLPSEMETLLGEGGEEFFQSNTLADAKALFRDSVDGVSTEQVPALATAEQISEAGAELLGDDHEQMVIALRADHPFLGMLSGEGFGNVHPDEIAAVAQYVKDKLTPFTL